MSAKHTPGPWFFRGTELRTRAAMGRSNSRDGWIVPLGEQADYERIKHGDAAKNRAIIENAPRLYEALDKAVDLLDYAHANMRPELTATIGDVTRGIFTLRALLREIES